MSTLAPELHSLRTAFRNYVRDYAPDIDAFCGTALRARHPECAVAPKPLPVAQRLKDLLPRTTTLLTPILTAIIAAKDTLGWRQSYTEDDPGIDAHYLANYGWFNLIAPSGPFVSDKMRLSVGFWGQGLTYPTHSHEPEEIYLTLAGSADYISHGRATVRGGPGTTICHFANQPHAADFPTAPCLAAAFWRGNNLEAKSTLVCAP